MARRRYAAVTETAAETTVDWRSLKPFDAFKLVAEGKLEQDLFEDFFQLTPIKLEKLTNG